MTIRSMTAFAQVQSSGHEGHGFTLSLKSVNHRFLEVHLRMPADLAGLEMKIRRLLKEGLGRGRVEVSLNFDNCAGAAIALDHAWIKNYVNIFREAAEQHGLRAEPDLNQILRIPGAILDSSSRLPRGDEWEAAAEEAVREAVAALNHMREEEGRELAKDLRQRMGLLQQITAEIARLRKAVAAAYFDKIRSRIVEMTGGEADPARILQEAALLAERSDVEEETVRMQAHITHFSGLLDGGGEVGKKMDFLLQEMNREANTMLSKTTGIAGEGLRITELGLTMKAEIEKSREQVQNIE